MNCVRMQFFWLAFAVIMCVVWLKEIVCMCVIACSTSTIRQIVSVSAFCFFVFFYIILRHILLNKLELYIGDWQTVNIV